MTIIAKLDQSASWDVVTNASVDETALAQTVSSTASTASTDSVTSAASPASQAAVSDPSSLTYFVRFSSSIQGESAPLDGSTLLALNSFSFDVQNPVTIGSATSGAGAAEATRCMRPTSSGAVRFRLNAW